MIGEWMADRPGVRVKFHNWWNAPKTWAQVEAIDPDRIARIVDGEFPVDAVGQD